MSSPKCNNIGDLELASHLLEIEGWNLIIVKKGEILASSKEKGIYPLFQAIQNKGDSLLGAALADKIVGVAVGMLCLYAGIASIYADTASQKALDLLKTQGMNIISKTSIPHVLNRDGTDYCPFEKLAQSVSSPSQLFSALRSLFTNS